MEIEGTGIESLVLLETRSGQLKTLNRPGSTITLPPGQYHVQNVTVEGPFQLASTSTEGRRFELKPGETHRLRLGYPLTPGVQMQRRGRTLQLDYRLTDADGRRYAPSGSQRTAVYFTIYAEEQQVASGNFEYG